MPREGALPAKVALAELGGRTDAAQALGDRLSGWLLTELGPRAELEPRAELGDPVLGAAPALKAGGTGGGRRPDNGKAAALRVLFEGEAKLRLLPLEASLVSGTEGMRDSTCSLA